MNKGKYISVQVFQNEYFLVDIMDFDYNIALNMCKNYWHRIQINQDTTGMFEISGFNIYSIFSPVEFWEEGKPNYKIIKCLNDEHFNKFFKFWNNNNYNVYSHDIENLKQNYKKYMNEAIIKDIIE